MSEYLATLCPRCRGGDFYHQADAWHCTHCEPPQTPPRRFLTIPGGAVHDGAPQDVDAVLARAVDGLTVTAAELRGAMVAADLDDIAHGRIGLDTVRAFALGLEADA